MNLDYSNPEENILFAAFENDLQDYKGNQFTVVGSTPIFREDAVVGKYMEVPEKSYLSINNDEFAIGTSDFTLDFWAYSIGKHCTVTTTGSANGVGIQAFPTYSVYGRQKALLGYYNNFESIALADYKNAAWAHYALVRKDGVCYAFVDGILQGKVNSARDISSKTLVINNDHTDNSLGNFFDLNNYYKAVRFCKFARWTEDFELPECTYQIREQYLDEEGNELKPEISKAVAEGEDFTTAAPAIAGYKLVGYQVDGGTMIAGSTVTLPALAANHTITFVYKQDDGRGGDGENNGNCCCCCKPIIIYNCCHGNEQHKCKVIQKQCNCCKSSR